MIFLDRLRRLPGADGHHPAQLLSDLLVSGGVKEEDAESQDAVEDSEDAVEGHVLLVLRRRANDERREAQRHDDLLNEG